MPLLFGGVIITMLGLSGLRITQAFRQLVPNHLRDLERGWKEYEVSKNRQGNNNGPHEKSQESQNY